MTHEKPTEPGWYPVATELLGFAVVQITFGKVPIVHYPWGCRLNPWKLDNFCENFKPTWGPRVEEWRPWEDKPKVTYRRCTLCGREIHSTSSSLCILCANRRR